MSFKFIVRLMTGALIGLGVSNLANAAPDRGVQDSGGGSAYEAEFKLVGQQLAWDLRRNGLTAKDVGFELLNFEIALKEVRVFSTEHVLRLDEVERNAINGKVNKVIVFNDTIWASLSPTQRRLLVMHEYLRFLNLDDSQYSYSSIAIGLLSRGQSSETRGTPATVDPARTAERIGGCLRVANSMSLHAEANRMRLACITSNLAVIEPMQCLSIANWITVYADADDARFSCIRKNISTITVNECMRIAKDMSNRLQEEEAKRLCLRLVL